MNKMGYERAPFNAGSKKAASRKSGTAPRDTGDSLTEAQSKSHGAMKGSCAAVSGLKRVTFESSTAASMENSLLRQQNQQKLSLKSQYLLSPSVPTASSSSPSCKGLNRKELISKTKAAVGFSTTMKLISSNNQQLTKRGITVGGNGTPGKTMPNFLSKEAKETPTFRSLADAPTGGRSPQLTPAVSKRQLPALQFGTPSKKMALGTKQDFGIQSAMATSGKGLGGTRGGGAGVLPNLQSRQTGYPRQDMRLGKLILGQNK
jgi:hypothetical protein